MSYYLPGLCLLCCCCFHFQLASTARVYSEFNGQHYAYNTDNGLSSIAELSPNYEWPLAAAKSWDWPQAGAASFSQPRYNINLRTSQMTHTQHTDAAGHVHGRYSYYDEAGYHELSYKAGAGIGFVVMGGNLAKPTQQSQQSQLDTLTSYR